MRTWVWVGHVWSERARLALDAYGDRITDVSIFGWHVDAAGTLTQTFNPDLLAPYRAKWPHLRFWLAFRNDGDASIASALLASPAAQDNLLNGLRTALEARPWLAGIDIDLERVGGSQNAVPAENLFRRIAGLAHSRGLECSAALPPLTAEGSVGGEDWARYDKLGQILDRCAIMSYDFAWSGSAPGPVSPGFWVQNVYDWAVTQIPPNKLMMGVPLYGYFWDIHNYPAALGNRFRGGSGTYYAAWQYFTGHRTWDGTDANPGGSGTHHHIGWLAFRDPDSKAAWGFLNVHDWRHAPDWDANTATVITPNVWDGRPYTVRYGRPAGTPLWSVTDNSSTGGASYTLTPRKVRDLNGNLVGPKVGHTVTVETLKRYPVAATVIDDNAGTEGQLEQIYTAASGAWSRWTNGDRYHQYRGSGRLECNNSFSGRAMYVMIRGQFKATGWVGVTANGITAEVHPSGSVRLMQGATTLGTATVSPLSVGSPAGDSQFVLALRVREGSARVYYGYSEARELPRVIFAPATPSGGTVGITATAEAWIDHLYIGDGWWYQPREAVEVTIGGTTRSLGRIPRTGITWDSKNRFRPDTDVDERETRTDDISLDWVYDHWVDAPIASDTPATIRVGATDHDVWVGRILAVDRDGATIAFWSDAETVAHWRDRATFDWGLSGIALWTLGQEDLRTWERLKGGELPAATKRLNS